MNDCMLKFIDTGAMHAFLDILSRNIYQKFIIPPSGSELLAFDLTDSELKIINKIATQFNASLESWASV